MKFLYLIVVVTLLHNVAQAVLPKTRLDNYKVYKVHIKTEDELKEFKKFDDNVPVFHLNSVEGLGHFEVVVDPANQKDFEERLAYYKFDAKVVVNNLQHVIEQLLKPPQITERDNSTKNYVVAPAHNMEWTSFHPLADIYGWLDHLMVKHVRTITPMLIGYSYEGRPIRAIRISHRIGNKAIFLNSNIHAIEWITGAAGTCFINKLLESNDPELQQLLLNYDWIFAPVLNPDGFVYTHEVHPLWRKNRRPNGFSNSSGICYGVDLNRNFGFHWGEAGWNVDVPCDHWYGGSEADSEPEVQAIQNFSRSFPDNYVRIYLSLHSYGNLVLLPYGHTVDSYPPNYDQLVRIGEAFAKRAELKHGTAFRVGTNGAVQYPVSGSGKDWAYGVRKIPFAATVELRDEGEHGFFLPPEQIIPVCEEITEGIKDMVKQAIIEGIFD